MKAQWVRVADVLVFGPFMIWAGAITSDPLARYGLWALGAGTIVYNGRNWLKIRAEPVNESSL